MATKLEINNLMIGLSAAYPDFKPKNLDETVKAYEEALQGFPADLLKHAVDRCRDTCLFFPKISEIRKAISEINAAAVKNTCAIWPDDVRTGPISPEIQKYLDDFRRHMEERGMWREARPAKI